MLHRGAKPGAVYRGAYKPGKLYKGARLIAGYEDVAKAAPASWNGTYADVIDVAATGKGKQEGTPTPAAPVPLVASEGALTASGRNLLMTNRETYQTNGITVARLADGRYHISGTPTAESSLWLSYEISLPLSAGTYTLAQTPAADELDVRVLLLPGWKQEFFVLTEATMITGCYINVPPSAVGQELDFVYGPQLERGGTAHSYRPYAVPATVTLPTLRAIPNRDIRDTLEYVGGGQWKVTRRVGVIQLTGTENWQSGGGSYSAEQSIVATGTWGICDTYAWIFSREGSGMYVAGSVVAIGAAAAAAYGSLDEWKRYLAERYDKDDPLTLWVRLATPTTETVTMGTLPSYPVHTELDISGDFPPDVIGTCKTGI